MNSFVLSFKFLSVQNKFSYRLVLEVTLIIALVVSISGMITGASTQFTALLYSGNTSSQSYLMIQKGTTFETSQIPINVINKIDKSYLSSYNPLIYKQAQTQNNETVSFIYADFNPILNDKNNFILVQGTIPKNSSEIMLGEGLRNQYFNSFPIPGQITLSIKNKTVIKTITGVFSDNSIYDYSLLGNINYEWSNITNVSLFKFQIKNSKVLPEFRSKTSQLAQEIDSKLQLSYDPLQKTGELGTAFYNDVHNLFFYLEIIMIILLSLKITHASYTLFNRYYEDFLILRILGMSDKHLQIIYYLILAAIGNIGLLYGFIAGIALPHVFLLMIRMVIRYNGLYVIIPNIQDIILLTIFTNVIIIANSFWITKMHLQKKLVPDN